MTDGGFQYLGPSDDRRTNRWKLTFPCGHMKTPRTTMFNIQHVQCDKCGRQYLVDYDKQQMLEEAA